MARIVRAELTLVDLKPMTQRTDAIQSFVSQETPILTLTDDDGCAGTGYTYTIGSGGSAVVALMRDHLLPRVIGMDTETLEANWRSLLFGMHALAVGPVSSLALAAIDIAFWDLRCVRTGTPLYQAIGGAHDRMPVYTTEGGWLHLSAEQLVDDAVRMRERGFRGAKLKIGKPHHTEDRDRLSAVRAAVGETFQLMVDANQGLRLDDAERRGRALPTWTWHGSRSHWRPMTSEHMPAWRLSVQFRSRSVNRSTASASSRITCMPAPAQWYRSMSLASAGSRPGSRSRTSPRRTTSRSRRTS
jgi:L-alanine-DL-glutamate epimerase-like enolase superfamily enzyme